MVGADMVITVLENEGDGSVRIGIDAPPLWRLKREEIHAAVSDANRSAACARAADVLPGILPLPGPPTVS